MTAPFTIYIMTRKRTSDTDLSRMYYLMDSYPSRLFIAEFYQGICFLPGFLGHSCNTVASGGWVYDVYGSCHFFTEDWTLYTFSFSTTSVIIRRNGTILMTSVTSCSTVPFGFAGLVLGSRHTNGEYGDYDIAEFLVTDSNDFYENNTFSSRGSTVESYFIGRYFK